MNKNQFDKITAQIKQLREEQPWLSEAEAYKQIVKLKKPNTKKPDMMNRRVSGSYGTKNS